MYQFNEQKSNPLLKKEDYFDIDKDEVLNLEKFGKIFMAMKNNEFSFQVLVDNFEGDIIVLELHHKLTIMIRLDQTHKTPKSVCF